MGNINAIANGGGVVVMLDPVKCFNLTNIRLAYSTFRTMPNIGEVTIDGDRCVIQSRRWAEHEFVSRELAGMQTKFLIATVHLGMRIVDEEQEKDSESGEPAQNAEPIYLIEAGFIAEFKVVCEEFDAESLQDFTSNNAPHVVWPFWRQHVCATLQSASLPVVQVPLMAKVRDPKPAKTP